MNGVIEPVTPAATPPTKNAITVELIQTGTKNKILFTAIGHSSTKNKAKAMPGKAEKNKFMKFMSAPPSDCFDEL